MVVSFLARGVRSPSSIRGCMISMNLLHVLDRCLLLPVSVLYCAAEKREIVGVRTGQLVTAACEAPKLRALGEETICERPAITDRYDGEGRLEHKISPKSRYTYETVSLVR